MAFLSSCLAVMRPGMYQEVCAAIAHQRLINHTTTMSPAPSAGAPVRLGEFDAAAGTAAVEVEQQVAVGEVVDDAIIGLGRGGAGVEGAGRERAGRESRKTAFSSRMVSLAAKPDDVVDIGAALSAVLNRKPSLPGPPSSVSLPKPAVDQVVAGAAFQPVVAGIAPDGVVAGTAFDEIAAGAAAQPVVAGAAIDAVGLAAAVDACRCRPRRRWCPCRHRR